MTALSSDQRGPSAFRSVQGRRAAGKTAVAQLFPINMDVVAEKVSKLDGADEAGRKTKSFIDSYTNRDDEYWQNRITLRISISHTDHSHIIGRQGRHQREVVKKTGCHIHFPDTNKDKNIQKKDNKVTIAGFVDQAEIARHELRGLAPLDVTFECHSDAVLDLDLLDNLINNPCPEMYVNYPELSIIIRKNMESQSHFCLVRGSQTNMDRIGEACSYMRRILLGPNSKQRFFSRMDIALEDRNAVLGPDGLYMKFISQKTGADVKFPQTAVHGDTTYFIEGTNVEDVFAARKYIHGLCPVQLNFDIRCDRPIGEVQQDCEQLAQRFNMIVVARERTRGFNGTPESKAISIRSFEHRLSNVYQVHRSLSESSDRDVPVCNDYDFMKEMANMEWLKSISHHLPGIRHSNPVFDARSLLGSVTPIPSTVGSATPTPSMSGSSDYGRSAPPTTPSTPNLPISQMQIFQFHQQQMQQQQMYNSAAMWAHYTQACANYAAAMSNAYELPANVGAFYQQHPSMSGQCDMPNSQQIGADKMPRNTGSGCLPLKKKQDLLAENASGTPRVNHFMYRRDSLDGSFNELSAARTPDPNDSPISRGLLKIINGISSVPPSREEQRILAYEAMTDKLKPDRERFPSLRFAGQGFSQSASSALGRRRMEEIVTDVDEENSSTSSSILPVLRDGDKWPEQSDSIGCSNHVGFSASSGDALGIDPEVFSEWDIDNFPEMGKILSKLDLVQHVDRFRDEEVDVEAFLLMGDSDLMKMGIKLGGRKKLMHAISYLKASKASKSVIKKHTCDVGMPNRV